MRQGFTAVDLFAGAGGVSLGLVQAGWKVLAACDIDAAAARSYRANHPGTEMIEGDLTCRSTVDRIEGAVRGRPVDLVAVCAPCQPFSARNQQRGGDPREQLIVKSLAVVERLQPQVVVFENVPGLTTTSYLPVLDALRVELLRIGYLFGGAEIHNCADFGVPQARKRCLMIAAKTQDILDAFDLHAVSTEHVTVRTAIGDLAELASGESDPDDPMHRARQHQAIALTRLKHIPHDGGSRSSLPRELWVDCHKRAGSTFPDAYGRLWWDRPAVTLTTGCCDITKGRYAHPAQDRALTMREAARLQSFPDEYRFMGTGTEISRQIGNAVPPALMACIAVAAAEALSAVSESAVRRKTAPAPAMWTYRNGRVRAIIPVRASRVNWTPMPSRVLERYPPRGSLKYGSPGPPLRLLAA